MSFATIASSTAQAPLDAAMPLVPEDMPEMYRQIGTITRQLHDALRELGVMPRLQAAAGDLPDARSRLHYVAVKTGEAAAKVLDSVEQAKAERHQVAASAAEAARLVAAAGLPAEAAHGILASLDAAQQAAGRIDSHLTDIMVAQDFHDLTGQVMARVMTLATDLEENLVRLLCDTACVERSLPAANDGLQGPAYEAERPADVVANQGEVDDLLASLGF